MTRVSRGRFQSRAASTEPISSPVQTPMAGQLETSTSSGTTQLPALIDYDTVLESGGVSVKTVFTDLEPSSIGQDRMLISILIFESTPAQETDSKDAEGTD